MHQMVAYNTMSDFGVYSREKIDVFPALNFGVLSDTVYLNSVKFCMIINAVELYTFKPVLVTLIPSP